MDTIASMIADNVLIKLSAAEDEAATLEEAQLADAEAQGGGGGGRGLGVGGAVGLGAGAAGLGGLGYMAYKNAPPPPAPPSPLMLPPHQGGPTPQLGSGADIKAKLLNPASSGTPMRSGSELAKVAPHGGPGLNAAETAAANAMDSMKPKQTALAKVAPKVKVQGARNLGKYGLPALAGAAALGGLGYGGYRMMGGGGE